MKTTHENKRRYNLHYNLKKKKHRISARERTCYKRAVELTDIENRWIGELKERYNYHISNPLFEF